jgi:hypothetical protein
MDWALSAFQSMEPPPHFEPLYAKELEAGGASPPSGIAADGCGN